jgi:short-subunit dehydrogenase
MPVQLSGFVPSPFMALYVSTKHAVEGYSDWRVR